ncbi:carbohydrate ABC transporter permease [Anaerocolumna xylanovorans]|uniref:Carbohydrate ABC transporter membrane protein 2, CUT1 family n=1 Tax=Anaerocolumna xylanovorans DSM 12503 TaxID=1121345 RepID=A0A1M7YNP7_9FIRM|nr:carbohydrate ABC transporter permease [Anaerocolumna xylanovorans]SHO54215.1 carbohydrate ABC transporter membrane protein 2, CUT1 family [Anaerocolumna xylanovorans DSM 12503]
MKRKNGCFLGFLLLLTLFVWIPVWVLCSGSFMGKDEILKNVGPVLGQAKGRASWSLLPVYPTLRAYVELLLDSPNFFTMFWNSCIQVIPVMAGQLLVSVPAAWAFAAYKFRGKKALFVLYIILMVLPFQITMVSSYLVLFRMKLAGTHLAVILPNIFSTFPVFIMTKFFQAVPGSLLEAARLDGASERYLFFRIGIPMEKSGIFSILILGFLEYWNAIEQPLTFLANNKKLWPLTLYLPNITTDNLGVAFSASVFVMFPALLLFLYGQKYLEQGITASGLKE